MPQSFWGWLFYEKHFSLMEGRAVLKASDHLEYSVVSFFFIPVVARNAAVLPSLRHFTGSEARKFIKKQPKGCLLGYLYAFYFGCCMPVLGLEWGSYMWYSCIFCGCVPSLHLSSWSKTVMYQKAKVMFIKVHFVQHSWYTHLLFQTIKLKCMGCIQENRANYGTVPRI